MTFVRVRYQRSGLILYKAIADQFGLSEGDLLPSTLFWTVIRANAEYGIARCHENLARKDLRMRLTILVDDYGKLRPGRMKELCEQASRSGAELEWVVPSTVDASYLQKLCYEKHHCDCMPLGIAVTPEHVEALVSKAGNVFRDRFDTTMLRFDRLYLPDSNPDAIAACRQATRPQIEVLERDSISLTSSSEQEILEHLSSNGVALQAAGGSTEGGEGQQPEPTGGQQGSGSAPAASEGRGQQQQPKQGPEGGEGSKGGAKAEAKEAAKAPGKA